MDEATCLALCELANKHYSANDPLG
jgi:hypothetical protein